VEFFCVKSFCFFLHFSFSCTPPPSLSSLLLYYARCCGENTSEQRDALMRAVSFRGAEANRGVESTADDW